MTLEDYKAFYEERRGEVCSQGSAPLRPTDHSHYRSLKAFIDTYELYNKKCLEIGSGIGLFQDMVEHYSGTDVADSLADHYHKEYRVARRARYPFPDGTFDAIWTIAAYEHVPDLQQAMQEIVRLMKPSGVLLFAPAWQCRPWAAQGYAVRSFREFNLRGKLIKASIPIRDSVAWRSMSVLPKRLYRHAKFACGRSGSDLEYRRLRANYDVYWTADSDACNHIDPHDAILWFENHGLECLSHPLHRRALFVRTGDTVFGKR